MVRKFFLCASAATLLMLGVAVRAHPTARQAQPGKQSQAASKTVSGKVTAIGTGGQSFTLEITAAGSEKRAMNFVVDKNTQIVGRVTQGTSVTVEYQVVEGGQNLATSVSAQA
jgi:hypothetical protein